MLKIALLPMLCGCVLLVDAPTSNGQQPELDCKNAQTQMELNMCSWRDYEDADNALNAQYKAARDAMRETDAGMDKKDAGAEQALIEAQRAWIIYRDKHCLAYGFRARGGSMEPMLVSDCETGLTRKRTEELKALTENTDD